MSGRLTELLLKGESPDRAVEEARRLEWVAYHVKAGEYDEARKLGWEGDETEAAAWTAAQETRREAWIKYHVEAGEYDILDA